MTKDREAFDKLVLHSCSISTIFRNPKLYDEYIEKNNLEYLPCDICCENVENRIFFAATGNRSNKVRLVMCWDCFRKLSEAFSELDNTTGNQPVLD